MRPRRSLAALLVVVASASGLAACDDAPSSDRSRWLATTLHADHQPLLARAPERVAAKYTLLAASAWQLFRGAAPQFFRDLAEPGGALRPGAPSLPVGLDARAPRLWLVGDPHLENAGAARTDDGDLTLAFHDFDAVRPGPFHVDVLRLATSFALLCEPSARPDGFGGAAGCEDAVRAAAEAYATELVAIARAEPRRLVRWSDAASRGGAIAEDVLRRAARDVDEGRLDAVWIAGEGLPAGPLEEIATPGVPPETAVPLPADLAASLATRLSAACERVLADPTRAPAVAARLAERAPPAELPRPGRCQTREVVARHGVGVASHALERFVAVVDVQPREGPGGRLLVDVKEAWDPPFFRELQVLPPRLAVDNGARIVEGRERFVPPGAEDPFNTSIRVGAMSLRVATFTASDKGFSTRRIREKLADGEFRARDVVRLAETLGRLLAEAHARSAFVDGPDEDVAAYLAQRLDGVEGDFAAVVAERAFLAATVILADHALFARMWASSHGPAALAVVPDDDWTSL